MTTDCIGAIFFFLMIPNRFFLAQFSFLADNRSMEMSPAVDTLNMHLRHYLVD
jgi:hypothetical protein